ncbi:type II CAAX endopeptidase family protein [Leifsonia sp. YIM 134122]|uniref:Type II CAAX endopeptidase family protein n=1 Tax=Leifsonia stereocauli TaxID=3134136 RepID=A0ABU9W478_9MICO
MTSAETGAVTDAASTEPRELPRRFWIGLVAVIVYVLFAAVIGNALVALFPTGDEGFDFALSHFLPLAVMIVAGVWFVRRAGWTRDVWRTPAAFEARPRRWWMLAFPVLMLAQPLVTLTQVDWTQRTLLTLLLVAISTAMVGFGEELYFRGILRTSLRGHHGETVTLLVTSVLFGFAHVTGSVIAGLSVGFIAFQVTVLIVGGAAYYGVFRATGRLWVGMALHALTDFSLYVSSDSLSTKSATGTDPAPAAVAIQSIVWALTLVLLISCIRQDRSERREKKAVAEQADQPAVVSD